MIKKLVNKNPRELSFTIFETIVAVGLLMAFTLEMAGGQGNIMNKVEYARRANNAIWLAKRIMSQVEYNYQTMDLKDLETTSSMRDQKFDRIDDPEFDYLYSVEVKEWKFPLIEFLTNGGLQKKEGEEGDESEKKPTEGAGIPGLDAILEQIFQGHILKIAKVEVSWPDGARRDSVSLSYLLTNTKALDEYLATKKAVFDGVIKKMAGAGQQQQLPRGGVCQPGEDGTNISDNGGCQLSNGHIRRPDGSVFDPATNQVISEAPLTQTPTPSPNPPAPLPPRNP